MIHGREISLDDVGLEFMNCALCLAEKPGNISPRNYARINVGFTEIGIQVWCVRHDVNIVHIDFEGCKHPAETRRIDRPHPDDA